MLIGYKFGKYACCFAHCEVVLLFVVDESIDKDIRLELGIGESFLNEILSDRLNRWPLSSSNCPLTSLLTQFAHCVWFPSWIICRMAKDYEGLVLGFAFVWHGCFFVEAGIWRKMKCSQADRVFSFLGRIAVRVLEGSWSHPIPFSPPFLSKFRFGRGFIEAVSVWWSVCWQRYKVGWKTRSFTNFIDMPMSC